MSIATWKAEFYPTPANTLMTTVEAIRHSLKKWEGAELKALEKHNVSKKSLKCQISDDMEVFCFNAETCALCHLFLSPFSLCEKCPLKQLTYRCNNMHQYGAWRTDNDPIPMIEALREALKVELEKEKTIREQLKVTWLKEKTVCS